MFGVIGRWMFLALCTTAAFLPMRGEPTARASIAFTGWPSECDGNQIYEMPLTEGELKFNRGFPGRIGKFTDGRREFVLRWVTQGTRQLHSSIDCFRGLGYRTTPEPAMRDASGARWSRFAAMRGSHGVIVRERITDPQGREWTDVSAWFWSVLLRKSEGPWLAVTVVEKA